MAEQSYRTSLPSEDRIKGIENRNFLSPIGFEFAIAKLPGVQFFCQTANIPQIAMDPVAIPSVVNNYYMPGDEVRYEPLFIKFLVDENMKNWYQVHDWIRATGTPVSQTEFKYNRKGVPSLWTDPSEDGPQNDWKSDASLKVLSSNYQTVAEFVFKDCFPVSLSTLNFDAAVSDINYFTAEVQLRYDYYDYLIGDAAYITDESMKPTYRRSEQGVDFY